MIRTRWQRSVHRMPPTFSYVQPTERYLMWTLVLVFVAMGSATAPTPAMTTGFVNGFASSTTCAAAVAVMAPTGGITSMPPETTNNLHTFAKCIQVN